MGQFQRRAGPAGFTQRRQRTLLTERCAVRHTDQCAQLHQSLVVVARLLGGLMLHDPGRKSSFYRRFCNNVRVIIQSGKHPQHISVHCRDSQPEADGRDGSRCVVPDTGQSAEGVVVGWQLPAVLLTDDRGKYTPDAIVFLDDGKGFVVEIKPLTEMANQSVQKKFKALLDFCEETGLGATLTDGRTDINHIFETIPNLAFEESILQSLKEFKKLTYGKVNELKNKYQVTTIHLLQCIIKNNLSYNSMPTLIWKTKKPIICDLLLSPENKMLLKGSTDIINNDKT